MSRIPDWVPWICAALNVLGAFVLGFLLAPGTEANEDAVSRKQFITDNLTLWRAGWSIWIAADLSLIAFFAWWGRRVSRSIAVWALAVAAVGIVVDFVSLSLIIGWLPRDMESIMDTCGILSGGIANGLFSLAGAILIVADKKLLPWLRGWGAAVWLAGFALTVAALLDSVTGKVVTTAIIFTLFCPWVAVMGWKAK